MKLDELRHLAEAGVRVEISAADLLGVCSELTERARREPAPEFVPLAEATGMYRRSNKSLIRDISTGVCKGYKQGGVWMVETPATRARRVAV